MTNPMTNQNTIQSMLSKMGPQIAMCLPKHLTAERLTRIALTCLRQNPKLQECEPTSFIASVMQAAQLGLEPGVLGQCHLVPFWNNKTKRMECQFMAGYRGLIDLSRRSGNIVSIIARAVYENDIFNFEFGLNELLEHKPSLVNKGEVVAFYAIALLKDGGHQFEVMSKNEINEIRDKYSKSKDKNGEYRGPWETSYDEMAKKTVLRRLFKWLPASPEMQKAAILDELQEAGIQNIKESLSQDMNINFLEHDSIEQKNEMEELFTPTIVDEPFEHPLATVEQLKEIETFISELNLTSEQITSMLTKQEVANFELLTETKAKILIYQLNKLKQQ
jgi:recombination protein RecT